MKILRMDVFRHLYEYAYSRNIIVQDPTKFADRSPKRCGTISIYGYTKHTLEVKYQSLNRGLVKNLPIPLSTKVTSKVNGLVINSYKVIGSDMYVVVINDPKKLTTKVKVASEFEYQNLISETILSRILTLISKLFKYRIVRGSSNANSK